MKLLINNWGEDTGIDVEPQTLPGNTLVEYINDAGDRYRVSPSENNDGLCISVIRKHFNNQLVVYPRVSNAIEVI